MVPSNAYGGHATLKDKFKERLLILNHLFNKFYIFKLRDLYVFGSNGLNGYGLGDMNIDNLSSAILLMDLSSTVCIIRNLNK